MLLVFWLDMLGTKKEKNESAEPILSKRLRLAVALAFIVLLGAGIYFILALLKKPSVGDVWVSDAEQPIIAEKPKENERFEGKYVSFAHFTSYKEKNHTIEEDEEKNILERAFFSEEEINAKKIALTVEKLPGGNMEESANYKMRETYSDRYKKEKFSRGEARGIAFSLKDQQSFEKVIFIQSGNLLAELALTSSFHSNDDLDLEIENIAGSVVWKK